MEILSKEEIDYEAKLIGSGEIPTALIFRFHTEEIKDGIYKYNPNDPHEFKMIFKIINLNPEYTYSMKFELFDADNQLIISHSGGNFDQEVMVKTNDYYSAEATAPFPLVLLGDNDYYLSMSLVRLIQNSDSEIIALLQDKKTIMFESRELQWEI